MKVNSKIFSKKVKEKKHFPMEILLKESFIKDIHIKKAHILGNQVSNMMGIFYKV